MAKSDKRVDKQRAASNRSQAPKRINVQLIDAASSPNAELSAEVSKGPNRPTAHRQMLAAKATTAEVSERRPETHNPEAAARALELKLHKQRLKLARYVLADDWSSPLTQAALARKYNTSPENLSRQPHSRALPADFRADTERDLVAKYPDLAEIDVWGSRPEKIIRAMHANSDQRSFLAGVLGLEQVEPDKLIGKILGHFVNCYISRTKGAVLDHFEFKKGRLFTDEATLVHKNSTAQTPPPHGYVVIHGSDKLLARLEYDGDYPPGSYIIDVPNHATITAMLAITLDIKFERRSTVARPTFMIRVLEEPTRLNPYHPKGTKIYTLVHSILTQLSTYDNSLMELCHRNALNDALLEELRSLI